MSENYKCYSTMLGSCILYSGAELDTDGCDLTICTGTDYDTIINSLYTKVCTMSSNSCLVKVSSTDDCCGYLQAKLISSDDSVSIEKVTDDETGCEVLDLTMGGQGYILLYNSQTPAGGDTNVLDAAGNFRTFSLPANTLATNGDEMVIEAGFVLFPDNIDPVIANNNQINIKIGSVIVFSYNFPTISGQQSNDIRVTLKITRQSQTSFENLKTFTVTTLASGNIIAQTQTAYDFDNTTNFNNSQNITTNTVAADGVTGIINYKLNIKSYKLKP